MKHNETRKHLVHILLMAISLAIIIIVTSCQSVPPWVGEHAVRIGIAIASEYAPEQDAVRVAIIEAIDEVQAQLDALKESGWLMEPTQEDYRRELIIALQEQGLDAETIAGIVDKIFPIESEIALAIGPKDYAGYLRQISDEL